MNVEEVLRDLLLHGPAEANEILRIMDKMGIPSWEVRPVANRLGVSVIKRASKPRIIYWVLNPREPNKRWILSDFKPYSATQRQWCIQALYDKGYTRMERVDRIPAPYEWIDWGDYISWTEPGNDE